MELSKEEYAQLVDSLSPKSPLLKDICNAFWVGGLICLLGQLLLNGYLYFGLEAAEAGTATSISLVLLGALLTGLSVYDNIAKVGGAGTLVPITGFSNAVCSAAVEFQTEGFITGLGTRIFQIAGPVITYGTVASVVYGIVYWVVTGF